MLRNLVMVGMVVAGLGTIGIAATPNAGSGAGRWPGADTPLGRMIAGNLGRLLVLRSELNLSAEQRSQVRDLLVQHRREIASTVQAVRAKRLVLRDAVLTETADEAAIRAAAAELGEQIGDAAVKAAKLKARLAPILTDEQRTLIGQFLADRDQTIDRFLEQAVAER
jgi:Spy/CpxP family protein refolding chaperone